MPFHAKPLQPPTPTAAVEPPGPAPVIDFAAARGRLRLRRCERRLRDGLERNRRAFRRLYDSGLVFTRHGTRAGRELLLVQQRLLRLLDGVTAMGRPGRRVPRAEIEALFERVDRLLERTGDIAKRNKALFLP